MLTGTSFWTLNSLRHHLEFGVLFFIFFYDRLTNLSTQGIAYSGVVRYTRMMPSWSYPMKREPARPLSEALGGGGGGGLR